MSGEYGREASSRMSLVTDERLMAFADGALPPDEARALEIMIAEDPALEARLRPFAMTGAPLAEVFDAIAAEPVPDRLLKTIAATPARRTETRREAEPQRRPTAAHEPGFLARLFGAGSGGFSFANAAAALALVVAGGAAGWTLAGNGGATLGGASSGAVGELATNSRGEIVAVGALASALETQPSSDTAGADGIVARSSFHTVSGDAICREYRMSKSDEKFGGVACRSSDGTWRIATHTRLPSGPAKKQSYETASDSVTNPVIDAAIGALITGDILTPDKEDPLRARGWK